MNQLQDRFVVLRHWVGVGLQRQSGWNGDELDESEGSGQSHFDWMFEVEGELRTWATPPVDDFENSFEIHADRLPNHRLKYLDYEGELSGERGHVEQVLHGHLCSSDDDSQRFTAELSWQTIDQTHHASVAVYRSNPAQVFANDGDQEVWRLRFKRIEESTLTA